MLQRKSSIWILNIFRGDSKASPGSVLQCSVTSRVLPHVCTELPLFQLFLVTPCPVPCYTTENYMLIFLMICLLFLFVLLGVLSSFSLSFSFLSKYYKIGVHCLFLPIWRENFTSVCVKISPWPSGLNSSIHRKTQMDWSWSEYGCRGKQHGYLSKDSKG